MNDSGSLEWIFFDEAPISTFSELNLLPLQRWTLDIGSFLKVLKHVGPVD
jgi:hypothetical protein